MDGCFFSAHAGLLGPQRLHRSTDAAARDGGRLLDHDRPERIVRCGHALGPDPGGRGNGKNLPHASDMMLIITVLILFVGRSLLGGRQEDI